MGNGESFLAPRVATTRLKIVHQGLRVCKDNFLNRYTLAGLDAKKLQGLTCASQFQKGMSA